MIPNEGRPSPPVLVSPLIGARARQKEKKKKKKPKKREKRPETIKSVYLKKKKKEPVLKETVIPEQKE